MKFRLTIFTILAFAAISNGVSQERMISMGDSLPPIPYSQFVDYDIIVMDINTVDGEEPTCEYINSPSNAWGKSITNATRVPGRMLITRGNNVLYDSGEYNEDVSGMTIRIRGNSSAYHQAKPYKIDLEQKADLLMRNNPKYADKDWVLIRDIYQKSMAGFELCRLLQMQWTPGYDYVSLIINDEYRGLYMLTESVKRNTNCRINITNQGFLFEYDSYWWTKDYHVPSILYPMIRYTVKYPDPLSDADKQYIEQRVADYENGVLNGTYDESLDVASLAKWTLGMDILGIDDAAGANRFLTLYDHNSKIVVPMMWDFDSANKTENIWSRPHRVLIKQLFDSSNPAFKKAFVEEWLRISDNLVYNLTVAMNRYKDSDKGLMCQRAGYFEDLRWNHIYKLRNNIIDQIAWFNDRKQWIDSHINDFCVKGDANLDWKIDVEDINQMINMILGLQSSNLTLSDMNNDKIIDVEDVNIVINKILQLD